MVRAELSSDGKLRIIWSARMGIRYRVQYASDLVNPIWQTVFDSISDGDGLLYLDSAPLTESHRYYRVLAE